MVWLTDRFRSLRQTAGAVRQRTVRAPAFQIELPAASQSATEELSTVEEPAESSGSRSGRQPNAGRPPERSTASARLITSASIPLSRIWERVRSMS